MRRALRLGGHGLRVLAFALAAGLMLAAQAVQAQGNSLTVSVAITTPANGAVITVAGTVQLGATASINRDNWVILEVDFYSGSTLIGKSTSAPYGITWPGVPAGSYTITARAIATNPGQAKQDPSTPNMPTWTGVSAPVTFRVNAPPTVTMTAPANNAVFNAPASITLTASAADAEGSVARVDFYQGTSLIGGASAAPFSINWTTVAAGSYSVTAVATDNLGATTTSAPITVIVNALPTVTLTGPANNTSYTAPSTITLTASASDADGTISKVEFLQGTTVLATLTAAPYTFAWTNVAQGTYVLSARATDNQGAATTSTAVTVTVKSAAATLYFIHPDHLNTPRLIQDQQATTVWRWDNQEPFGNDSPNGDPNSTGTTFDFPMRFPGQYYDRETNLAYNYFRDYDPSIGRYLQSDPIGLDGGMNTFAYVRANPLKLSDPTGLKDCGSGQNERVIPNNPFGFAFKGCCDMHDDCYDECGGPTKFECDFRFWNCMTKKCGKYQGGVRSLCENIASKYAGAVSNMGDKAFNDARGKCPTCKQK